MFRSTLVALARLTAVLAVALGLLPISSPPVPAGAALATPAPAAAERSQTDQPRVLVRNWDKAASVEIGGWVRTKGRVSIRRPGLRVRIEQRLQGFRTWKGLRQTKTRRNGNFSLRWWPHTRGVYEYRVVLLPTATTRGARSERLHGTVWSEEFMWYSRDLTPGSGAMATRPRIGGVLAPTSLVTSSSGSPSIMEFDLAGRCDWISFAVAATDDSSASSVSGASVTLDGRSIVETDDIRPGGPVPEPTVLDARGAKVLRVELRTSRDPASVMALVAPRSYCH